MSAPRFLLDTNIVSDLVRHPQGRVAKKNAEYGEVAGLQVVNWLAD